MSRGTPLRSCAECGGSFLGYAPSYFDQPYFCPKCAKAVVARREKTVGVGAAIHTYTDHVSTYVILSLDPDGMLTVRKIGFPESPSFQMHRNNINYLY